MNGITKTMLLLGAALIAAPLGGCHSMFNGPKDTWSAQSAHPITVASHLVSVEVHVAKGSVQLGDDDGERVARLAADYRARGTGKLSIASPETADGDRSMLRIAGEMTNIATDQGVDPDSIEVSKYRASEPNAPIVMTYSVYEATPSACGNWTKNYAFAPLNHETPDLGCATQNNLAAEVENPRDLIIARDMKPADQARRAYVLDQYRKGLVTSSQKDAQATGTVSEVGGP